MTRKSDLGATDGKPASTGAKDARRSREVS
jgi:hypothetical protein